MADPQKLRTRQKFVRASCCCAMGRLCWQWFICWWYLNAECSSAYQNRYLVQQQRVVFGFFSSVRYCWFSVISGKWARMNSIEHQSNHEKENVHFVVAFVVSELYCWILGICCDDCALCIVQPSKYWFPRVWQLQRTAHHTPPTTAEKSIASKH